MALRWFLAFILLSSLLLPVTAVKAQTLDQYGGYASLPSPSGATGFFRTEKIGNRWVFVTPAGNQFWLRAVYVVDNNDGGSRYLNAVSAKYSDGNEWRQQARRLKAWGFNAFGEYTNLHALPVSVFGSPANPEQLPFLFVINAAYYGMRGGATPHKNIYFGVNTTVNPTAYIGTFPDVFDPAFRTNVNAVMVSQTNNFTGGAAVLDGSPWLIGITTDDGDFTTGFGPGPAGAVSQGKMHPHLGWVAAVTRPTQISALIDGYYSVTYTDTKVYTKYAWRDFLVGKYGTITALNTAWGSTYTTFDSAGGWGSGTGLLDEDGRHAWIGTNDPYHLSTATPAAKADMDAFLSQITGQYFASYRAAMSVYLPHHLLFTPATMQAGTRQQVLSAAGAYVDAIQSSGVPLGASYSLYQAAYNASGKPLFVWTTLTAQSDANLLPGFDPNGWGNGTYNYATQALRGGAYQSELAGLLGLTGSDGSYFVMGIDWWEWTDKTVGGENMNFGLVSNLDNAYDGKEAIIAAGTDPWGYRTGGEPGNYGDFLDSVKLAHSNIAVALGLGGTQPPASTAVSITSPTSGSTVQQTVTVSAVASSSAVRINLALDGGLVGIFSGTVAQYPWNTTTSPNGTHTWTATAYDSSGNAVSSAPDSVVVQNSTGGGDTTPPVVAITQPANGGTVARKSTVSITATASDNVGVTRVEFYLNGSLKCSDTTAPYACVWQVPAAGGKTYQIQAKGYDAAGNVGSSSIVTVTAH